MKRIYLSVIALCMCHNLAYGEMLLVGISGGSAAGKSTLAVSLQKEVYPDAVVISLDDYGIERPELSLEERMHLNWDGPEMVDVALLVDHINQLKKGDAIHIPIPDLKNFSRSPLTRKVEPAPIVILEGLHLLSIPEIRKLIDIKIYIEASDDIRLARRIKRDIDERNAEITLLLTQYLENVKPMHERYIAPSKNYADIVISGDEPLSTMQNKLLQSLENFRYEPLLSKRKALTKC